MTPAQSYTIKEMLEKMSVDDREQRTETNKKIDSLHVALTKGFEKRVEVDEEQDKKIISLQNWRSGVVAVIKTFAWIISGSGVVTVVLWIIFGEKID